MASQKPQMLFVAWFHGYNQYWLCEFMVFVVLCSGAPKGSTGSGSGFKRLRRRSQGLKSHRTNCEKPGIKPATPVLQDIGLSYTPWRLDAEKYLKFTN